MASNCRGCGALIDWGYEGTLGRWVPLEPVETHEDLPRRFLDEDGVYRADHRDRHGGTMVNVQRLGRRLSPLEAQVRQQEDARVTRSRKRRERHEGSVMT